MHAKRKNKLSEQEMRDAQNRTIGVVMAIRLQEQLEAIANHSDSTLDEYWNNSLCCFSKKTHRDKK